MRAMRAGAAAVLVALAGCAWEENARGEYEPILAEHRAGGGSAGAARREAASELAGKAAWTVEDCLELAFLYNEELLAAGETYYQAAVERDRVLAEYLPRLDAFVGYFREEEAPGFAGASGGSRSRSDSGFRVTVPVFSGTREYHAVKGAGVAMESAAETLRHAKSEVALAVTGAFHDVLTLERSVGTLESSVETQRRRRTEMEERVKAGVSRKTELLLVEAQLAQNEARLGRARNDVAVARERLSTLLGGASPPALAEGEAVPAEVAAVEELSKMAWDRRRDLKAAVLRRKALEKAARAEEGSWLPSVDFRGNVYTHRTDSQEDVEWDLNLEGTWNLFEGGGARARMAAARSEMRQADLEARTLRLRIGFEVKQEYFGWKSLGEDVASFEKEVAASEENYRLLQEEYAQRLATNLEVELARDQLLTARLNLDRARIQRKAAWYRILYATGQLP